MGTLNSMTSSYRLLYVQPEPEVGERVCIGVVLEETPGRFSVLYDSALQKLRCVAPHVDLDLLRFFLDDFRLSISESEDIDLALRRYGPQVSASASRTVHAPITETTKMRLLERFAMSHRDTLVAGTIVSPKQAADQHLAEYIATASRPHDLLVSLNPTTKDLFGRSISKVAPVAAAIRGRHRMLLLDGVDLNALRPGSAVSLTNRIVHNFWQYARLRETDLNVREVAMTRVAIVLNGAAYRSDAYSDAHDYAMDQFRKGADVAIDTGSPTSVQQLDSLLREESGAGGTPKH